MGDSWSGRYRWVILGVEGVREVWARKKLMGVLGGESVGLGIREG